MLSLPKKIDFCASVKQWHLGFVGLGFRAGSTESSDQHSAACTSKKESPFKTGTKGGLWINGGENDNQIQAYGWISIWSGFVETWKLLFDHPQYNLKNDVDQNSKKA